MDKDNLIKRWLFEIISWIVVVIYFALNIGVSQSNYPLLSLIIILPVMNIVIIAAWFYFRGLRNSAINSIKHQEFLATQPDNLSEPQYGKGGGQGYIPNVTIESELFDSINGDPENVLVFDMSFKDYLQPGKKIVFHNKVDYGDLKKVEVVQSITNNKGVEVGLRLY